MRFRGGGVGHYRLKLEDPEPDANDVLTFPPDKLTTDGDVAVQRVDEGHDEDQDDDEGEDDVEAEEDVDLDNQAYDLDDDLGDEESAVVEVLNDALGYGAL